jgi:hypothetical protein
MNRNDARPPSTSGLAATAGNPSRDTITNGIAVMHTNRRHTENAAGRADPRRLGVTDVQTVTQHRHERDLQTVSGADHNGSGEGVQLSPKLSENVKVNPPPVLLYTLEQMLYNVRRRVHSQFIQVEPKGKPRRRCPISLQIGFQPGRMTEAASKTAKSPDKCVVNDSRNTTLTGMFSACQFRQVGGSGVELITPASVIGAELEPEYMKPEKVDCVPALFV